MNLGAFKLDKALDITYSRLHVYGIAADFTKTMFGLVVTINSKAMPAVQLLLRLATNPQF